MEIGENKRKQWVFENPGEIPMLFSRILITRSCSSSFLSSVIMGSVSTALKSLRLQLRRMPENFNTSFFTFEITSKPVLDVFFSRPIQSWLSLFIYVSGKTAIVRRYTEGIIFLMILFRVIFFDVSNLKFWDYARNWNEDIFWISAMKRIRTKMKIH